MEILKKIYPLIVPYTVFTGVLYEWGYWGSFHINIIQYMALPDVVKSFAYPFATSFVVFLVGALLGSFQIAILPEGGGADTKIGRFLNRFELPLAVLWVLATLIVYEKTEGHVRWTLVTNMSVLFLCLVLQRLRLFHNYFESGHFRFIFTFIFVSTPIYSLTTGLRHADLIIKNIQYNEAIINKSEDYRLKYLGIAGDYTFLLSFDNSVIYILPNSSIFSLALVRVENT